MPRDPSETRNRLLDAAEGLILDKGFAGTTVDAVIERASVTKGAFFHHFKSKADLGRAVVERYAQADRDLLEHNMERAERLSNDPLQQLLIFIGLLSERIEEVDDPGCLFASYCYEAQLFDAETLAIGEEAIRLWRRRLGDKLREAVRNHPGLADVHLDSLADMLTVVIEGAFIVSRTLKEPEVVTKQLAHLRNYIELLAAASDS